VHGLQSEGNPFATAFEPGCVLDEVLTKCHGERRNAMKSTVVAIALVASFLFAAFSVQGAQKKGSNKEASAKTIKAIAVVEPTQGNEVRGVITFTREKNGTRVVAVVKGLTQGTHGFHIHEKGDCSAPDGESAGGHFNPQGNPHSGPTDVKRHAGDLGNMEANVYGNAYEERVDQVIVLEGPDSIIGRAVIIHAQRDDLTTQPTGAAGARVACGVIREDK
jgi:superoxide dismutase, Cu-Zn family